MKKKSIFIVIGGFIVVFILIMAIFSYTNITNLNRSNKENQESFDYAEHIIEHDNIFEILNVTSITDSFLIKEYKTEYVDSEIFVKKNNIYKKTDKVFSNDHESVNLDIMIGYVFEVEKNNNEVKITFIDMSKLKAEALIPIEKSNELNNELEVFVTSFGTRIKYAAKITYVDYKFIEVDGKYFRKAEIIIDNSQNFPLLINNPIELNIKLKEIRGILVIPERFISYIYESEGQKMGVVFIKNNGEIIETLVFLGLHYLDKYEIIKGLEKDNVVVLK